jgi:hypothetical protein
VKLMSLYPTPTQAGLNNNYSINRNNRTDVNSFDSRLDQVISPKDQLFVRYSLSRSPSIAPRRSTVTRMAAVSRMGRST